MCDHTHIYAVITKGGKELAGGTEAVGHFTANRGDNSDVLRYSNTIRLQLLLQLTQNLIKLLADFGALIDLGILSAANIYGLDFVPLWDEEYDLLATLDALQSPAVKDYLSILSSDPFRERVERMGGYRLDQPGRVKKLWI